MLQHQAKYFAVCIAHALAGDIADVGNGFFHVLCDDAVAVAETVEEDTFAPAETPEEAAEAAAEPAIVLPDNYIEDAQAGVAVVEEISSDADTAAADTAADDADNDKPTA